VGRRYRSTMSGARCYAATGPQHGPPAANAGSVMLTAESEYRLVCKCKVVGGVAKFGPLFIWTACQRHFHTMRCATRGRRV